MAIMPEMSNATITVHIRKVTRLLMRETGSPDATKLPGAVDSSLTRMPKSIPPRGPKN
jgi:hypothetical protein